MKLLRSLKHLVTAAALLMAAAANAAVIYNNGAPNASGGNDATQWVQAEDFSFALNSTVGGAGVYIAGYNGIGAWDGTMDYFIFADAAGSPGVLLASGAGQNVTTTDSGIAWCCGGNAFLVEFDFASNFIASAGATYWLGIHLSTNFDRDDIYWVTTANNATVRGNESINGTFNNWFNNGQEHAFFLNGERDVQLPEPPGLLLLGIALLGLGLARRRMR